MKYKIYNQDVIEWAEQYQKGKFHALLSDAPYHLTSIVKRFGKKGSAPAQYGTDGVFSRASRGFMGQEWDGGDVAFRPETWEALGEHLYPGAFGMVFSASRNWHRLAVAIEDAGMVIHPTIFGWLNGQGFPKATNISKQIDKQHGVEPIKTGKKHVRNVKPYDDENGWNANNTVGDFEYTKPATEMGQAWEGHRYGLQALKPAVEPIIIFQKPYEGRPLDNIVETGAGALNIDGGRIPLNGDSYTINTFDDGAKPWGDGAGHKFTSRKVEVLSNHSRSSKSAKSKGIYGDSSEQETHQTEGQKIGRWPANFILDESSAELLDAQSGILTSGKPSGVRKAKNNIYGQYATGLPVEGIGDSGGASRFFYNVQEQIDEADPIYYCSKVSPAERNAGLDERCMHPTLKPISLAKYLATLLLPPDEYSPRRIMVPFSGVGSEMIGAALAGWEHIVGIEFDKENGYVDMAHKRIEYWSNK